MRVASEGEVLDTHEVHIDDIGEVIDRRHRGFRRGGAGIGHNNVESTELLDGSGDERFNIISVGDIGTNGDCGSARFGDFLANRVDLFLTTCGHHHMRAGLGVGQCNSSADTATRTSHDRDLSF